MTAKDPATVDALRAHFSASRDLRPLVLQDGVYDARRALRMLGDKRGGLTDADLAALDIHDDQIKLMTSFGGFWTALHLTAVTIFLLPYLIFATCSYVAAQLMPCTPADCISLRRALWEYVSSSGQGNGLDWTAIGIFILLALYNLFRISLVYKARALKLAEEAAGIPRLFVLRGYWLAAYYGVQILVWVNLALVLLHAYRLLETPVHRP